MFGMTIDVSVISAVVGLLGVALGASFQYLFTWRTETRRELRALRTAAYIDFLRAVALSAHQTAPGQLGAALRKGADAKARISIYGDAAVIRAIAAFDRSGATLHREESREAFFELAIAMRKDSLQTKTVPDEDIRQLLWGTQ
ncbi:MAG: hypothetical protein H7A22_15615 [Spirochaetales bacterium]|nr:hypothetical protein [Spirochaetales bacterium]